MRKPRTVLDHDLRMAVVDAWDKQKHKHKTKLARKFDISSDSVSKILVEAGRCKPRQPVLTATDIKRVESLRADNFTWDHIYAITGISTCGNGLSAVYRMTKKAIERGAYRPNLSTIKVRGYDGRRYSDASYVDLVDINRGLYG